MIPVCKHRTLIGGSGAAWCGLVNSLLGWKNGFPVARCVACTEEKPKEKDRAGSSIVKKMLAGAAITYLRQSREWRAKQVGDNATEENVFDLLTANAPVETAKDVLLECVVMGTVEPDDAVEYADKHRLE